MTDTRRVATTSREVCKLPLSKVSAKVCLVGSLAKECKGWTSPRS
jgi:hypothetical protein